MLLNSVGMMGEVVVLGWLSLELTNSPFLVGVAMSMRALPLFFVGAPAGALADRFSRRRLLMVTGSGPDHHRRHARRAHAARSHLFGHLLLLTLVAGTLRGLEHAARQSYTHDVVGAPALLKGLAVLGIGMRSGWLLGSLGAGAIIAHFGSGAGVPRGGARLSGRRARAAPRLAARYRTQRPMASPSGRACSASPPPYARIPTCSP